MPMASKFANPLVPELRDQLESLKQLVGQKSLANASSKNENMLIVSPYEDEPHLLDLRTLDLANQLLAKALVGLNCLREDYATAPYVDIFNVCHPVFIYSIFDFGLTVASGKRSSTVSAGRPRQSDSSGLINDSTLSYSDRGSHLRLFTPTLGFSTKLLTLRQQLVEAF
jgi:hypothetical protein